MVEFLSLLAVVAPLVLLLLWFRVQQSALRQRQLKGLEFVSQLKQLIALTQRHRGSISGFLAGEAGLKPQVMSLRYEISQQQQQLNVAEIQASERWRGYQDHWLRLQERVWDLTVPQAFQQHTQLIANLLFLLEDIAEQQGLTGVTLKSYPQIGLLWRELMLTAECIGQSRAVGAAMLASGQFSGVDKIRLGFLSQKIRQMSQQIQQQLRASAWVKTEGHETLAEAATKSDRLLAFISLQLESEQTLMTATEYFGLASQALDAYYGVFEQQLVLIRHALTSGS